VEWNCDLPCSSGETGRRVAALGRWRGVCAWEPARVVSGNGWMEGLLYSRRWTVRSIDDEIATRLGLWAFG